MENSTILQNFSIQTASNDVSTKNAIRTTYLNNLTPLRGIAALLTVLYHIDLMFGAGDGFLIPTALTKGMGRMYLMVDFFFILSGFIMCYVYGKLFHEGVSGANFKKFTIARFARVYPLHLITLLYLVVLFFVAARMGQPEIPIIQIANTPFSILTNLLLLHSMNFHQWFSWNHASWSISTEWWAYMVFPFLVKPFTNLSAMGKGVVAFLCFVGYLAITFFIIPLVVVPAPIFFAQTHLSDFSINVAYQFGYLRCLFGFILGMMMYEGYKTEWCKKHLSNGYMMVALFLGMLLSMHLILPDVITVSFMPFILLCGAYGSKNIDRLFALKPLQRLGDWSFSIYLVHQPLFFTIGVIRTYLNPPDPNFKPTGPPPPPHFNYLENWLIAFSLLGIILILASLTYRFWEKPTRAWINGKSLT